MIQISHGATILSRYIYRRQSLTRIVNCVDKSLRRKRARSFQRYSRAMIPYISQFVSSRTMLVKAERKEVGLR